MTEHPYRHLPAYCFWRQSAVEPAPEDIDPVVSARFLIHPNERIVTAGSCFAQHLAKRLHSSGFNHFVTESPHPFVASSAERFGYGIFSARYGNIYTSRQLVQLLQRAYGLVRPLDDAWEGPGSRVFDPFRPRIQPDGFASMREFLRDRQQHFDAVRRAFDQLDVFVFTLGLTEVWIDERDGMAYPLCPGVAAGEFAAHHELMNLSVSDVISDLQWTIAFITSRNSSARFIFTVSPVPLIATAENRSVIASTAYSKAVLRVAAEHVAMNQPNVAYFPAFEVITSTAARSAYFAEDLRSVTDAGVSHVMRLFLKHYGGSSPPSPTQETINADAECVEHMHKLERMAAMICDEEMLQRAN
jgi:hypothetical protein